MTNNESKQQQYPQNYQPYEDEINLIDYLKVLWKWKWLIIAGTLICAIVAAVISLQMPKIYEISTVIEPGIIGVDKSGNYIYMNSKNISGKINEGAYNKSIKKLLNIDPSKINLEFKADVSKFANQIRIATEFKEKDINLGLKASKQLIAFISDDGEKVIQKRNDDYDKKIIAEQNKISKIEMQWRRETNKQIVLKLNNIERKRNQIKLQQQTLEIARQRIKELELEAKKIKDNTEKIIKQRNILLKDSRTKNDTPLLLCSTMIQQNMSYSSRLGKQIYNLRANVQTKEANIEELKLDAGFITTEIEEFKLRRAEGLPVEIDKQTRVLTSEKENISNIKVIQNPEVSSVPVKSKKKQIVLLSVVVGLFFMIFLAFFVEYIKNATRSTKQTK